MKTRIIEKREINGAVKNVCVMLEKLVEADGDRGILTEQGGRVQLLGFTEELLNGCRAGLSPAEQGILDCFAKLSQRAQNCLFENAKEWIYFACVLTEELLPLTVYENPMVVRHSVEKICGQLLRIAEEKRETFVEKEENCMQITDDSDLGQLLWKKITAVGATGYSCVGKSETGEDSFVCRNGHLYPGAGMIKQQETSFKNPYVLVSLLPVQRVEEILPFMTICAKEKRPIIIVAEYMEEEVLSAFRYNILHGGLKGNFLLAYQYGTAREEFLSDLAAICSATVISRENGGFEAAETACLGTAEEVTFEGQKTFFYTKDDAELKQRMEALSGQEERLEFLSGKVAELKVGGFGTEQDSRLAELKFLSERLKLLKQEGIWKGANPAEDYLAYCQIVCNDGKENREIAQKAMECALAKTKQVQPNGLCSYQKGVLGFNMACSLAGELVTMERMVLGRV